MQGMWSVLRENGQMSNLQRELPTEMVSCCWSNLIFVFFCFSEATFGGGSDTSDNSLDDEPNPNCLLFIYKFKSLSIIIFLIDIRLTRPIPSPFSSSFCFSVLTRRRTRSVVDVFLRVQDFYDVLNP